jgi:hypothetical protein
VSTPSRRTFTHAAVLLGAGLFALGGVSLIPPLRALERWMVKGVAYTVEPETADIILDGNGSQKSPWTRRKSVPPPVQTPPRVLNIDDDPEGYFSTSPLAPIDHSVIFAGLSEAGHKVLGVGHLMAWDDPEPLAMEALRKQLDRFDAAVLALPLARGANPEPVATPFLRWSIPESDVQGKVSALPQVNRIAVPNAEQGGAKSLAGFSLLENESDPGADKQPLLARWDDRIVFAFPLAVEIAAEGLTPADVIIEVGKEIRLGPAGQVIGIDEFGRGSVVPGVEAIETPAKRMISEGAETPKSKPLLTRDIRADLSAADKAWSDQLPGRIQALRAAPRYQPAAILPRPDALLELLLVSLLALAGTAATALGSLRWRIVAAVMIAGLGFEFLYLFAARQNAWLPPVAMLCPGFIALGLSFWKNERHPESATAAETPAAAGSGALPKAAAPSEARPDLLTDAPVPESSRSSTAPEPETAPAEPNPVPSPEPDIVEVVAALGFPAEYAWDAPPAAKPAPDSVPATPKEPPTPQEPDPEPAAKPARKAAKKAAAKTAAKKAAKKAPAKKAARKSARKPAADESGGDPDPDPSA